MGFVSNIFKDVSNAFHSPQAVAGLPYCSLVDVMNLNSIDTVGAAKVRQQPSNTHNSKCLPRGKETQNKNRE